jgi:hypothetical protein
MKMKMKNKSSKPQSKQQQKLTSLPKIKPKPKSKPKEKSNQAPLGGNLSNLPFSQDLICFEEITDYSLITNIVNFISNLFTF